MAECRVLLLPGWLDSGPAHRQSRWEALLEDEAPAVLVAPPDTEREGGAGLSA